MKQLMTAVQIGRAERDAGHARPELTNPAGREPRPAEPRYLIARQADSFAYANVVQSPNPPPILADTSFELRISQAAENVVVAVAGEVDMATAPELAEAIAAVTDSASRVVVDLTQATFLDSSALNALVHGQRVLANRRIEFRVVSPADRIVRRAIEITQLEAQLGVVESLPDALN